MKRLWKTCAFLLLTRKPLSGGGFGGGLRAPQLPGGEGGGSMFAAWVFFNVEHCEILFFGVEAVCFLVMQLFGKCSSNVQSNVRDAENQCSANVQHG